jgi:7-cyano-7-deazaguanine synthase
MSPPWPPPTADLPLAVLCSGGLDSAILLGEAVRVFPAVVPIYVRVGTLWENAEQDHLLRFLRAIAKPVLKPLVTLDQPVGDLYAQHWSFSGDGTPRAGDPEEDSYLPGRNILLFAKPLLWCAANRIRDLATAPLASNPFPDASPEFYDGFASLVSRAVNRTVRIVRPYADLGLRKRDVLHRGAGMPLVHTFSCVRPVGRRHCGACSKCGERRDGFRDARMPDPTDYASP